MVSLISFSCFCVNPSLRDGEFSNSSFVKYHVPAFDILCFVSGLFHRSPEIISRDFGLQHNRSDTSHEKEAPCITN